MLGLSEPSILTFALPASLFCLRDKAKPRPLLPCVVWLLLLGVATVADADCGPLGSFNCDINNDNVVDEQDAALWYIWRGEMLPGDVDGNGFIDTADSDRVTAALGTPGDITTDVDGDGSVTQADLDIVNDGLGAQLIGIPGDGNWDFFVENDDYSIWSTRYGESTITPQLRLFPGHAPSDPISREDATAAAQSGDFVDGNADGVIDAADYTVWRDRVGIGLNSDVDINQDGAWDLIDLQLIEGAIGTSVTHATPEPTAAALLVSLLAGLPLRRR